jgi:hypothetical protein
MAEGLTVYAIVQQVDLGEQTVQDDRHHCCQQGGGNGVSIRSLIDIWGVPPPCTISLLADPGLGVSVRTFCLRALRCGSASRLGHPTCGSRCSSGHAYISLIMAGG